MEGLSAWVLRYSSRFWRLVGGVIFSVYAIFWLEKTWLTSAMVISGSKNEGTLIDKRRQAASKASDVKRDWPKIYALVTSRL